MSSSVDGLVSGMQTSTMITQLMKAEAAPQTKLKGKVETAETAITSYLSVNAKLKTVSTAAYQLSKFETWRSMTASASSDAVTVAASGDMSGMAGSIKFNVDQVARAQSSVLQVDTVSTDFPATFSIQKGSWADADLNGTDEFTAGLDPATPITVDSPRTAAKVAEAVNNADLGIRAYVVTTGENKGALQFTGTQTGAANGFQISGLFDATDMTGAVLTDAPAKDAVLEMNPGTPTAYKVNSASNTFSSVMPGVTITAVKEAPGGVTVNATPDLSAMTSKIQAYVEAANAAFEEIKTQTAFDPQTRKGAPLTGDFTVRQMNQAQLSLLSGSLNYDKTTYNDDGTVDTVTPVDFGSLSQLGIQLDRGGQLTFNAREFEKAYATDPTKIQDGAIAFGKQSKALADKQQAVITDVIVRGRKSEIDSLNGQIENWDVRLATRKAALQRQYASLETSLGKLQNQSSWLSGQLGGLS